MDEHLQGSENGYLVREKCTIADIAHYGWVTAAGWAGVGIDEFPHLRRWEERMVAREGVERGRHVPSPHRMKEMSPEEMERKAAESKEWTLREQAKDAKRRGSDFGEIGRMYLGLNTMFG